MTDSKMLATRSGMMICWIDDLASQSQIDPIQTYSYDAEFIDKEILDLIVTS